MTDRICCRGLGKTAVCTALILANPAAADGKKKPMNTGTGAAGASDEQKSDVTKSDVAKPDGSLSCAGLSAGSVQRSRRYKTTVVLCNNSNVLTALSCDLPSPRWPGPLPAYSNCACSCSQRSSSNGSTK